MLIWMEVKHGSVLGGLSAVELRSARLCEQQVVDGFKTKGGLKQQKSSCSRMRFHLSRTMKSICQFTNNQLFITSQYESQVI